MFFVGKEKEEEIEEPSDGKIKFRKPTMAMKRPTTELDYNVSKKKKSADRKKEKKEKKKGVKNKLLLSFGDEEEEEETWGRMNALYHFSRIL